MLRRCFLFGFWICGCGFGCGLGLGACGLGEGDSIDNVDVHNNKLAGQGVM